MEEIENGSRKKRVLFVVLAVALLVAGSIVAFFFFFAYEKREGEDVSFTIPVILDAEKSGERTATLGEEYRVFAYPPRGFSVEIPQELIIEKYTEEDEGETFVFRQPEARENIGDKIGFQVYLVPFPEEVISRERILQDLPAKAILELQTVTLNPAVEAPVQGLLFWSEFPEIGKTREVWFAHAGFLYAITTYAHLDLWLAKILSTWRFER